MKSVALFIGLTVLGASPPATAEQGAPSAAAARPPDFKVVFWRRRDQPIETFQYQAYDVRKGEYTAAVVDWIKMMRERFPAYSVAIRDVDLEVEKGPNEARKVGAVIHREMLAAAAEAGVFVGPLEIRAGSVPTYRPPEIQERPAPVRISPPYSPLGPMFNQNPLPSGFPVPTPYPRPHP